MPKKQTNNTDHERESPTLKEKWDSIYAENQDLKYSLNKMQSRLEELKSSNNDLLKQVEFLRGQIKAYQYIVNCRR